MAQSEIRKKELDRIRKWISRAESRGYYIEDEVRLHYKEFSTQKLKALTPQKLYEKSWLITEDEALPGLKGRYQERQTTAKKISETQKANYASARQFYGGDELKKKADELTVDVPRFVPATPPLSDEDTETIASFGEDTEEGGNEPEFLVDSKTGEYVPLGEARYKNLQGLISQFSTEGREYLNNLLNSEVKNYGEDAVMKAISEMSEEMISGIQQVLYYLAKPSEDASATQYISPNETHRRLKDFADFILGTIPEKDRAKEIGRIMDTM